MSRAGIEVASEPGRDLLNRTLKSPSPRQWSSPFGAELRKRDIDPDRDVEGLRISSNFVTGGHECGPPIGQRIGMAEPGRVPGIRVLRGELEHARFERCDQNRDSASLGRGSNSQFGAE